MAKTIKFNLTMDDHPVRTIEGLQEHFSIEDILSYYENGLLARWLKVRGYDKQLVLVEDLDSSLPRIELIKQLIGIFDVKDIDNASIEEDCAILSYAEQREMRYKKYKEIASRTNKIIYDYHEGYTQLIDRIIEHKDSMALIKADIVEMEREYMGLFSLNYEELFYRLRVEAPKAIFAMLTKGSFRTYWLRDIEVGCSTSIRMCINEWLDDVQKVIEILGDDVKVIRKNTQGMVDPIESEDVEVMVLAIEENTFVRDYNILSEKLGVENIKYNFVRLKGLQYQSQSENKTLLYMEV